MTQTSIPTFETHFASVLEDLRGALTDLYHAVGVDPDDPQTVSRALGFHRNLAWKFTRLMKSAHSGNPLPYLPGGAGFDRALAAFERAGAPTDRLAAVSSARAAFDGMVQTHAGDRATLELMLDSTGLAEAGETLEVSRKLAFQGNSGIWGVQARARFRLLLVRPNPERPDLLDMAQASGLIDLRRFRPGASCLLFDRLLFNDDGTHRETVVEPFDKDSGGQQDNLLWKRFCSDPLPAVRVTPTRLGARHELVGDRVGNSGRADCVHGGIMRRFAPRYRDENNHIGEFSASIGAPTENLLFDVLVHRDLASELILSPALERQEHVDPQRLPSGQPIPFSESIRRQGATPSRLATPLIPRYREIVEQVYANTGWDPAEFEALRFEMKCPPLPSTILLRYPLPERPQDTER